MSTSPTRGMNNQDDYAIVIGISHYPKLADLASPANDAKAIAAWLIAPNGGGLPFDHVTLITSDDYANHYAEDAQQALEIYDESARPTLEDVDRVFSQLVKRRDKNDRIGRRLYIYLSGHGYAPDSNEVALLMANALPNALDESIGAKAYADFFIHSGAFDEVVLFVDCDRTIQHQGKPASPRWIKSSSSEWVIRRGTFLYAFSAAMGKHAYESTEASTIGAGVVHGFFTQALLEGLSSGAAGTDGRVTPESLHKYVVDRTSELSGGSQHPEFIFGGHSIVFGIPTEQATPSETPSEATTAPLSMTELKQAAARKQSKRKQSKAPTTTAEASSTVEAAAAIAATATGSATAAPRPSETERVATQADDPATVDELSRRPFAEVIGVRIEEVWQAQSAARNSDSASAFMVHIHGPWGSGKTSVLNFLRAYLKDENRPAQKTRLQDESRLAEKWVVVEFNAWRNQRVRPPWWTLIKDIYLQSAQQLGFPYSLLLWVRWLWWRIRADWFPPFLAALSIMAVILLTTRIDFGIHQPDGGTDALGKGIELGLKILTAVIGAGATVFALSRSLVFGSARAAQTYTELRSDPLSPIVQLFKNLIKTIRKPVIIFIDDLDRCDSKYVIELLEGIQTLFRRGSVTYVVAADRKWICSSFEKEFEGFGKTIGEPGRPLGYLFLEKVFQVSASIPRLSPEVQHNYWLGLLRAAASDDPKDLDKTRQEAESVALETVKGVHTQKELEKKIAEVSDNPVQEQAMRVAAAKQITSPEAQRETQHRLQPFSDLLEANPRSMKRLVNAYGLHQATHFLEGRNVSPEALALWTIIEMRWPLLADFLTARPQHIADLTNPKEVTDGNIPVELKDLFGDDQVRRVVGGNVEKAIVALDEAAIRQIVGLL